MKSTRCGLDIAKQVFQVHGVNEHGIVTMRKTLRRAKVLEYFAQLTPCLIGIEACSGAHYWARELGKLGHTVKLMASQLVMPYRKRGKNDANDAEAICEAVGRPNMHFVAVKSEEQQAVLMVHRARSLAVETRTALVNQIRGLLGEFGLVVPISLLPEVASLFGVSTDDLLGRKNGAAGKRGPTPKLQQQIERLSHLPKAKQKVVMEMLEGVLSQANC